MTSELRIETERLLLRSWTPRDLDPLAAMHADLEVMHDHRVLPTRVESDAKLARYQANIDARGFGRMAVEDGSGGFLGYVGIMPIHPTHSERLVGGVEIGWRLVRAAWGKGYATEAAAAALKHGFRVQGFPEVLAFTSPTNLRSQAVMRRLGMSREADRDFSYESGGFRHDAVVFAARP